MPQSWRDNWPPLDDDPSEGADRDELVHTLGNLTLVTARLNPALGNMAWNEHRINARGAHLASLALAIWPLADQLLAAPVKLELDNR